MPIDEHRIAQASAYRDPAQGISERFVDLTLRSGRTMGVLSEPLDDDPLSAWVVAHSFGQEHVDLMATEARIARTVAASGNSTLRFHCQGYGESEHLDFVPTPQTHVDDLTDAVSALRHLTGLKRIGVIGVSFGSAVALLAAQGSRVQELVLVAPVVSGRRYIDGLFRSLAITYLARKVPGGLAAATVTDLRTHLQEQGFIDYRGFPISAATVATIGRLDLLRDPPAITGRVLLVAVSVSSRIPRPIHQLADALRRSGATVDIGVVASSHAGMFGQRHVISRTPNTNTDALHDLNRDIGETIASWMLGTEGKTGRGEP